MREFVEAFKALRGAPKALWLIIFAFALDGAAYFGMLPLMKAFLGEDVGVRPELASTWVSAFTAALTGVMLFVGKPTEGRLGIRKSILLALLLALVGRILYSSAPFYGGAALVAVSLGVVALGEGILQPVAYAGVKRYTTPATSSMGFALLYAWMNFGAMLIGPVSATVRTSFDAAYKAGESALTGFNAVNWVCTGLTLATLIAFGLTMTRSVEARGVRVAAAEAAAGATDEAGCRENAKPATTGGKSPFADARFLFFIFALLPVRTLFAHQWLTMPEYVLRSYPPAIADRMEWFVDSINPLVIFLGVPTLAALTKRFHVLSMMITGSLVSAAATFLLCAGPHTPLLIAYFVVFSIGEALWSSRFLEYTAEIAPEGRVAQYMGVANLPWFVAKGTTGLYSGFVLERFVPKDGENHSGTMWLLYGLIAMASPVALIAARRWLRAGMLVKAPAVA